MKYIATFFILLLMACTVVPDPAGKPQAQLTFAHMNRLALLVEQINVIDNNEMAADVVNNKALYFPTSPAQAMKNYLDNRFMADGGMQSGTLTFYIEEATLPFERIQSESRVLSSLSLDEKEEYTVNYRLKIVYTDANNVERIKTTLRFSKSRQFKRSLSIADLEVAYLNFMEEVIKEMDKGIVKSIEENFKLLSPNQPVVGGQVNYGLQDAPAVSTPVYNGQIDNSNGYFQELAPKSPNSGSIQTESLPASSGPMPLNP